MASTGTHGDVEKSREAKILLGFFTDYLKLNHMEMEAEPPTVNTETFDRLITTYHANNRRKERITPENIQEFKQALQTRTRRVFYDATTRIYKIINKGEILYYHFSKDLQHLDRVSPTLFFKESQNKNEYESYEQAYDDSRIIKQVVERDRGARALPDDFEKQVTLEKSYWENKSKILLIVPEDDSKACWKLIFSEDWETLVTLYTLGDECKTIRRLYETFKRKSKLEIPQNIKIYQKKKVPVEWFEPLSGTTPALVPILESTTEPVLLTTPKQTRVVQVQRCERCGGDIICASHNPDVENLNKAFTTLCDALKKKSKTDNQLSTINLERKYKTIKENFVKKYGEDGLEKFFNLNQIKRNYEKCKIYESEQLVFKQKYLKYKIKYINLKKQLEQNNY